MRDEVVPAEELAKAKSYVRGKLVLGLEDPRSIISFGLRGLVLEGRSREITEVLEGLRRHGRGHPARLRRAAAPRGLRFAAIGPVDDASRFERLLDQA